MLTVQLAYDTLLIFPVGLGPWCWCRVTLFTNMAPPPWVQILVLITPGRESLLTSCGCMSQSSRDVLVWSDSARPSSHNVAGPLLVDEHESEQGHVIMWDADLLSA
jgi:hypothetical protein